MVIRRMEKTDVEAASAIERASFSMPWSADDFLEMVEADYAFYYVAELEGEIAGCCGIRNLSGEGEITNVVVADRHRRKGIARKMMEYMLQEAEKRGSVKTKIETARRLYEMGISLRDIAKASQVSVETVEQWLGLVRA